MNERQSGDEMRYLVTGAAGFIGAAVSDALMARGDHVLGIDDLNSYYAVALKRARLDRLGRKYASRFAFSKVDFANEQALDEALEGQAFDAIVHLGAQAGVRYSLEAPRAYVRANVTGHLNILELARTRGTGHLVYASSSSVYGGSAHVPFTVEDRVDHPLSLYAATKKTDELMSETYAHLYRIPQTGLRFFTVYGPWGRPDMMMWIFTGKILAGEPIPVFNNGDVWRDFTFIDDIVSGVIACVDKPPADDGSTKAGGATTPHALYNIGNNQCEHLMDVIGLLERACGKKAKLEMLPMQPGDVLRTFADIGAMERDFGYSPTTSVEDGVPQFVDWFRHYHDI